MLSLSSQTVRSSPQRSVTEPERLPSASYGGDAWSCSLPGDTEYLGHSGGGPPSSPSAVGRVGSRQSLMYQTRKISTTVKTAQPGMTTPSMMLRTFEASFPSLIFSLAFEGCPGVPIVVLFFSLKRRLENNLSRSTIQVY